MDQRRGQVNHEQKQAGKPIGSWTWHQVWSGAGASGEPLTALPVDSESILLWTCSKSNAESRLSFEARSLTRVLRSTQRLLPTIPAAGQPGQPGRLVSTSRRQWVHNVDRSLAT